MGRVSRKNKKSRRLKRLTRLTRSKSWRLKSKTQRGGSARMDINYDNGSIKLASGLPLPNPDFTEHYKQNKLAKEPTVEITGLTPRSKYLLTMTDPDAPNGKGAAGNHVWTHWVLILSSGTGTDGRATSTGARVIVPYAPPSPPRGRHRYEFRLYGIDGSMGIPRNLETGGNERGTYFSKVLEPFIKDKKLILEASYIVDSSRIGLS